MLTLQSKATFGNPKRRWRQKNIPITTFQAFPSLAAMDDTARLCRDAGFTTLEFLKGRTPEELTACVAACEKYGLSYILEDWRYFGAFQDTRMSAWTEETLAKAVETYGQDASNMGYYVWDEPYPGQFPLARKVVDTLERLDPAHLPYTVALPCYQDRYTWANGRYEEYLTGYADTICPPVLSLDYYPYFHEAHNPGEVDRGNLYNDIGLLRKLSLERDTPFWFYFQCWRARPGDPPLSSEMVRHQFYNALLHGAKGMQWFIIFDYIVTHAGTKGYMFDTAKTLNAECKALENTLLGLTSRAVYFGDALPRPLSEDGPAAVNARFAADVSADPLFAAIPRGITVGTFTDGYGHDYAMVQNRDYEAYANVTLPLRKAVRLVEISRADGHAQLLSESADRICMELHPGDAVLLRLDEVGSDLGDIVYTY